VKIVLGQFSDSFLEILNPIREERQCLSTHVSLEARISYLNCDCFEEQVTRNSSFVDFLTKIVESLEDEIVVNNVCCEGSFVTY